MKGIIHMNRDEFRENNLGVRTYTVTFFNIPIYTARFTSTNNMAVRQLTELSNNKTIIKGFRDED